jgi:Xaa-Pro aminopeptidase
MDVAGRLDRLREGFDAREVDALVVTNLTNIRYLTGFTGSSAMLLVTPGSATFVSDGRYTTQSQQELGDAGVDAEIVISTEAPDTATSAAARGIARLGLEADSISWSAQQRWANELFAGELVACTGAVEDLRLLKDPGEAARIRAACAIADQALAEVRHLLGESPTEREFGLELDSRMLQLGAEDLSFETIVASGTNGARPHHSPSDHLVSAGEMVVIDFGAMVDGYHSDMTRMVAVGDIGDDRQRMIDVVAESQAAGVEAVAEGADAKAVDSVCREVINDAGWGDAFLHGTGHGVGLDIHEEPRVSTRSTATLRAGYVVTVEPGVYLPELGGVRIEDTLLVTPDGCDRLTQAPKNPQIQET